MQYVLDFKFELYEEGSFQEEVPYFYSFHRNFIYVFISISFREWNGH